MSLATGYRERQATTLGIDGKHPRRKRGLTCMVKPSTIKAVTRTYHHSAIETLTQAWQHANECLSQLASHSRDKVPFLPACLSEISENCALSRFKPCVSTMLSIFRP